jgi:hypothetical protein
MDPRKLHPWLYLDLEDLEEKGLIARIPGELLADEAIEESLAKLESVDGNPMTQEDLFYVTSKGKKLI